MKNKTRSILLGVLCAVCLQAPVNVGAVELPIVPVDESQAEATTAVSETPAVTQKPAEQETPVVTEAPAAQNAVRAVSFHAGPRKLTGVNCESSRKQHICGVRVEIRAYICYNESYAVSSI